MEIAPGIHKWEAKVAALKNRYEQDLGDNRKLAIWVGMLPKEYQDMVLQNSTMMSQIKYDAARDYVLNVASQKMQMACPVPMDVGAVDNKWEDCVCGNCGDGWGLRQ